MKRLQAADLFCGLGGFSSGLAGACQQQGMGLDLLAINHWTIAIDSHSANHPGARHLCTPLETVDPRKVVPGGRLHLLLAAPECRHHSNARGGKPMSDQQRAQAWRVLEWAEALYIENILIENVREFRDWGPLGAGGRPLKSKKGQLYQQFLRSLRALGYTVEDRLLCAADYGDATTRTRLFIQARRGRRKCVWPDPTHRPPGSDSLGFYPEAKPWRAAREIIDWSLPSQSIFARKKPLADNTMARIFAGLRKFCGAAFILPNEGYYRGNQPRSTQEPLPTITSRGAGALVEPFVVPMRGGPTAAEGGVVSPFLVILRNNMGARSLDRPVPTLSTARNVGLCEPFLVNLKGRSVGRPIDEPAPTLTAHAPHLYLAQPFLIGQQSGAVARSTEEPVPTVAGAGAISLVQPYIIPTNHGRDLRGHSISQPMPAVTTVDAWGLIEPYLLQFNGTADARPIDEPLPTVTARDRFGLVTPELAEGEHYALLDIHFRMLQPHELARAQGFPDDYEIRGNREQRVKQIGNAIPVNLSRALCAAVLGAHA